MRLSKLRPQTSLHNCGPAVLAALFELKCGVRLSLAELAPLVGLADSGSSYLGLEAACRHFGLPTCFARIAANEAGIAAVPEGSITQVVLGSDVLHFVLIVRKSRGHVYLYDPLTGDIRKVSNANFIESWVPVVMYLNEEAGAEAIEGFAARFRKGADSEINLRSFLGLFSRKAWGKLVLAWIASLLLYVVALYLARMYAVYFDMVIPSGSLDLLHFFVVVFVAAAVLNVLLRVLYAWVEVSLMVGVDERLFRRFLAAIFRLGLAGHATLSTGELIGRMNSITEVRSRLVAFVTTIPLGFVTALLTFVLMFKTEPLLALTVVFPVTVLVVVNYWVAPMYNRRSDRVFEKTLRLNERFVDSIDSIESIKALSVEGYWEKSALAFASTLLKESRSFAVIDAAVSNLKELILLLFNILIFTVGAAFIIKGYITTGLFLTFNAWSGTLFEPVLRLLNLQTILQQGSVAQVRLNDILSVRGEEDLHAASVRSVQQLDTDSSTVLELRNVSYSYRPTVPLISNLDLRVCVGEKIAVVGATGAGKTTLAHLMVGYVAPRAGDMSIYGKSYSELSLREIRNDVCYVPAESSVIEGTIYDNVTLGRSIDDDVLNEVFARSGLEAVCRKFPQGANEYLGAGGVSLSRGEKRILLVARALASSASVFIFDEITSGLDFQTRRSLESALMSISASVVFLTHDYELAFNADRTLVLDEGSLAEVRSFSDLERVFGDYR